MGEAIGALQDEGQLRGRDFPGSVWRLDGINTTYSSPVGAGGRVYVTGRNGTTLVIEHGQQFQVLARNTLDDRFTASAAPAGSALYLRGHKSLYCIAGDDAETARSGE